MIRLLGAGRMADVYLARQASLGRLVALKVLSDGVADDSVGRGRFEREARAAAALDHRNAVSVFHFGYALHGLPFLVMQSTLADLTVIASAQGDQESQLHWFLETAGHERCIRYLLSGAPWLDGSRDRPEFQTSLAEAEQRLRAQQRELTIAGEWTPEAVLGGRAREAGR